MSDLVASLDRSSSPQEFLTLLRRSYNSCSNRPDLLLELAKKCERYSLTQQAELITSSALRLHQSNGTNSPVLKEYHRYLVHQLVDRWHFLMLNDIQRNSSYFKAIVKAVRGQDDEGSGAVLDIGSGTGILSMMAVRAGARKVYACELSEVMVELSKCIFDANQLSSDQIELIHSVSTDIDHLPERVSLIITETVDAGLLGEMIIPTIRHAHNQLVSPSTTRNGHVTTCHVIPCAATVYVCAIECTEIRRKSKLLNPLILSLTKDLTIFGSCHFEKKDSPLYTTLQKEPYTCERLSFIRGGFKYLTSPQIALQFNFSNPQVPLPSPSKVDLTVTSTKGTIDALVSWFTLHLDDEISFSTSPSHDTSWDQAIYPVLQCCRVFEGQALSVNASCTDLLLTLSTDDITVMESASDQSHSVMKSTDTIDRSGIESTSNQAVIKSTSNQSMIKSTSNQAVIKSTDQSVNQTDKDISVYYIERSELSRLNDELYIQTLTEALSSYTTGNSSTSDDEQLLVLDLTVLPLFSLLQANNIDYLLLGNTHSYYYQLVEELLQSNCLQEVVSLVPITSALITSYVQWDVILCEVVTPQGVLDTPSLELLKLLNPESCQLLCPVVDLHIMGVASPTLRAHSSVLGTVPTLGFDIARFINKYQVTHYTELDLSTIPHTPVTTVATVSLSVANYCKVNTVLPLQVISNESLTGFSYWFTLHYHGNSTVSTGPDAYPGSHWYQSVFLLQEDTLFTNGQIIEVQVSIEDGVLDISSDSVSKLTLPPHSTIPTYSEGGGGQ